MTDPSFSDSLGDGERLFAGVDCMMSAINEMTKWCEQVKFHETLYSMYSHVFS